MEFVGRKKELEILNSLTQKNSASLAVIKGRRRVGKSRLILEFLKNKNHWFFSGLPPTKSTTKQSQIDAFTTQVSHLLKIPKMKISEWHEIFTFLGELSKNQKIVLVFDEISWMGSKDPDFLGQLKNAWDYFFSQNPNFILILCGSVSTWIEENILSHTGFLGRVSVSITLEELTLSESNEFWRGQKNLVSSFEKLKILSVTGGIPKYLEEIHPEFSAEKTIQKLCFSSEGLLFREFEQIFSDLFSQKSFQYKKIVSSLAEGKKTIDSLCKDLQIQKGGSISAYLNDLILSGFISEEATWNLKTQKISSLKEFRLKDNYLRFYLKYIEPNREKILQGLFDSHLTNLANFETIIGLQFENLVLNNLSGICKILHLENHLISRAGGFFQRATIRQKGCQIDLLIQTTFQTLFMCEIKFSISEIKKTVIDEVKEKIRRLSIPKGYSIRPVLIHVNGVGQSVKDSGFFNQIIDFAAMLN